MNYLTKFTGKKLSQIQKMFIEKNHYTKTARSQKETFVFELLDMDSGVVLGVAVFGQPCGANVEKKYGTDIVELRRFCIVDEAERNSASWFLSRCIKQIRQMGVKRIVTYSDPNFGHTGGIYKATNFQYVGKENNNPRVVIFQEMKYTIREMYQKTKYGYTKKALALQHAVKTGEARVLKMKQKDVFLMEMGR